MPAAGNPQIAPQREAGPAPRRGEVGSAFVQPVEIAAVKDRLREAGTG
jgi:hypothetical protein